MTSKGSAVANGPSRVRVPHYINHFRNGLLCLGETTSMSCLDSCFILDSAFGLYINIMRNWCPFAIEGCVLSYLSSPILIQTRLNWEHVGQVCPEGHDIGYYPK